MLKIFPKTILKKSGISKRIKFFLNLSLFIKDTIDHGDLIINKENGENVDLVVGYGTFITNKMFKLTKDVKVCFVPKCRRIYIPSEHFPFALEDPSKDGFFALLFKVEHREFKRLDFYEGVDAGLFYRKKISILVKKDVKNYVKDQAFIYFPTEQSISDHNITLDRDKEDEWIEKIRANPEICEKFPELLEKDGDNIPNFSNLD